MRLLVSYSRRKWAVLVLVHLTYVCTEQFWMAVASPLVVDLVLVLPQTPIFRLWMSLVVLRPKYNQREIEGHIGAFPGSLDDVDLSASLAVDVAVRAGVVLLGAILNALFSYVFDLTFYRGTVALLMGVAFFLHAWFNLLPLTRTYETAALAIVDVHQSRVHMALTPGAEYKLGPDAYADYVFLLLLFVFVVASTEVYVFAEPWTFATVYVYYISVAVLTAVGDAQGPQSNLHWWALLIFTGFWGLVLAVIYPVDLSRKHDLSSFFT